MKFLYIGNVKICDIYYELYISQLKNNKWRLTMENKCLKINIPFSPFIINISKKYYSDFGDVNQDNLDECVNKILNKYKLEGCGDNDNSTR